MAEYNQALFIVNPVSGGGRTRTNWQKVEKRLRQKGYHFDVRFTERPLHATMIAGEALQRGYTHIIAVGGDGTINEALNGFYAEEVKDRHRAAFSVLPMGTASDFSRVLQTSARFAYIEKLLTEGIEIACDVARASYTGWDGQPASRCFINVADIGIGSDTVVRVNRNSKALGGFLSFLMAFLTSVFLFKNPELTVEVDGNVFYTGKSSLVAVNNGKYFGGGMMIAPHAEIADGLLDITVLGDLRKTEFLKELPGVYKGKHLHHPKNHMTRGKTVKIAANQKIYLEVDGESPGVGNIEFEILTGDLRLKY